MKKLTVSSLLYEIAKSGNNKYILVAILFLSMGTIIPTIIIPNIIPKFSTDYSFLFTLIIYYFIYNLSVILYDKLKLTYLL